ncbi:MAG: dTDP-4-dehydrorhamnose 3,5-epimerase [Spartobacteria bacterium]
MQVNRTDLDGVLLLTPQVFEDARGFFLESWNQRAFDRAMGKTVGFVQDNFLHSKRGVLRGLHYQVAPAAQGKLVFVLSGSIFDVVVDVRPASAAFGKWIGLELKAESHTMVWIPEGFAHGFLVTSDTADVAYKTTGFYSPEHERRIRWDDPDLNIAWPLQGATPFLSSKDANAASLAEPA